MTNEIFKSEMVKANNETFKQKFFTTEGRIDRMTYLNRNLILMLMAFVTFFVIGIFGFITNLSPAEINVLENIIMILILIPSFFLDVKRLHDLGKDSTLAKIFLGISLFSIAYNWAFPVLTEITPINIVANIASLGFMFYLLFARGEDVANQYGVAQ